MTTTSTAHAASTYPVAPCVDCPDEDTPIGVIEIADRLDVKTGTVHQWLFRQLLPPADFPTVNGRRAWRWATIREWAEATGRSVA